MRNNMAEKPPIDVNPQSWLIVRSILRKHVPDREVWAFGSRAKWTAKEYSDLDIAIVGDKPLSLSLMAELKEDFQDSALPFKIDVVDCAAITPVFRKVVETDKVILQLPSQSSWGTEWPYVRLGDYCEKIGSGATPKGGKEAYLSDGPYRLIRSQNIYNDGFKYAGLVNISHEQAKKLDGVTVNAGDVLLNITGDSVARVCSAPSDVLPARVNQHVAIIRPAQKAFDARFIRYYLAAPQQQELLLVMAGSGATRDALTKGMIESLRIPKPPLNEQKAIAGILASFDNRIALLRETNATLEAIAQSLFKSWFVDFDPIHAKQQGRTPEGMDEATAALFPDGFEESELGLVPRGWGVAPIGDVVESVGGGTPDTKESSYWHDGKYCWTTPKDLSGIQAPVLLTTERKLTDKGLAKVSSGLLPTGTLLLSSRAPIGYLAIAQVPMAINQGYIAMLPNSQLPPLFMLFWCRQNMETIKSRANGSTFMEISKKAFRPIPILVPSVTIIDAFVDIAGVLFDRLVENEKQAQSIATLRDTLLPRLISGQLRLPEAESQIEAAMT
jgi:type I restriction enzyme S subunit